MNPAAAAGTGIFVGIGLVLAWNFVSVLYFEVMDSAALNADEAPEAQGSVTSTSTGDDGYGGISSYFLHYEFHVPLGGTTTSGKLGPCGSRVTGKLEVTKARYERHSRALPKDCVARYVPADPRRSTLVSIGDDDNPGLSRAQNCKRSIAGFLFGAVFLGISLSITFQQMGNMKWGTDAYVGFLIVCVICVFLAICTTVRARMRISACPGRPDSRTRDFVLYKLDSPYVKPSERQQAAPKPPTTRLIAVVCPDGVSPGQTFQITTPNGAPMQVEVPAGFTPGCTFHVSVPVPVATTVVATPVQIDSA